jgi:PEGA domain
MVARATSLLLILSLAIPSAAVVGQESSTSRSPNAAPQASSSPAVASQTPVAPVTSVSTDKKKPLLEDGTPVKLRIARTVSSADAKVGETVDFEVLEEVQIGDYLVIPKSGVAWATVTEAQSKRRMGRGGKLDINIDSVRISDGRKIPLRAVKETKGGGHVGAMTGAIVATSIVFFPAAPLFLFMHGKDITIPKGTEVTAYVNGNVELHPASEVAVAKAAPDALSNIHIASQPASADIEVDGAFVGNTPSSVQLAPGDHKIVVKKTGFKEWTRVMKTSAGDVNVSAELEKGE